MVCYAHRRATAGVSGGSVRQRRAEGGALAAALLAVYVFMAALAHAGASDAVFYWVYVVTATLIVLGVFWAARSAIREDWLALGLSIAIMLVAAVSALAGPRGMWLSDGVGRCVVLLAYGGTRARQIHAPRSAA